MKTIYFVRHGESESNVNRILSGSGNDINLTPKGHQQAKLAGQKLSDKNIQLIISSPMLRAVDTATIIANELGYAPEKIVTNPQFIERAYGIYDGNPVDEYVKDYEAGTVHASVETEEQLYERLKTALAWVNQLPEERIVIVAHGGVRRAVYVLNEGLHHSHMYKLEHFDNGAIYEFNL